MSKRREQTPPRTLNDHFRVQSDQPMEGSGLQQSPVSTPFRSEAGNRQLLQLSEDHARQVQLQPLQKKVKKALESEAKAAASRSNATADSSALPGVAPLAGLLDHLPDQYQQDRMPQVRQQAILAGNAQQQVQQPPLKKVKKATEPHHQGTGEVTGAPTPSRNAKLDARTPEPSAAKRQRRNMSPVPDSQPSSQPMSQPEKSARHREREGQAAPSSQPSSQPDKSGRQRERGGQERSANINTGVAWVLSEARQHLETMAEVDGVRQLLQNFPECVVLGGIAARREFVASLLGEHAPARAAAVALVAPGMRQPLALELRCNANGPAATDLASLKGPELDAWLERVSSAASAAFGHRLKLDPLRLRLSTVGCTSLDIVDLPEAGMDATGGSASIPTKIEEMRVQHMGFSSKLLVCLEAGSHMDLARRFDPKLQRTVLLGAAAVAAGGVHGITSALPPSMLHGLAAAQALEERYIKMCHERMPAWITGMEQLEVSLTKSLRNSQELAHSESGSELLSRARAAGLGFGSALQQVISGTPSCVSTAMTLEEELMEFAAAAASSTCGVGPCLSGKDAAAAAEELWSSFNGIDGYIGYIRAHASINSADVPLNGGSAWHRLMQEIEVAMRLVHPSAKDFQELAIAAIQAGGTGVNGHQRWDDVAAKLLIEIAYEPLRKRIRYVVARVVWALQQQKSSVVEWMATVGEGPSSRMYSPLFAQHLQVVRSSAIARDLVFSAFDKATTDVAKLLLKNLEGTLNAMCLNPRIMCRPSTEPDHSFENAKPCRTGTRDRVKAEMKLRSGSSGGVLVAKLRDRIFEPRQAKQEMPKVQQDLCGAFKTLANVLANQTFAFADTSLSALCRRHLDEAMNAICLSPDQQRALDAREGELQAVATQARGRLEKVRRCLISLKSARSSSLKR